MISRDQLIDLLEHTYSDCVEVVKRKNADYTGDGSPFANFEAAEHLGISTTEQAFLTRMTDKMTRLATLTKPGAVAKVSSEAIEDTLMDLINYAALLKAYLKVKEAKQTKMSVSTTSFAGNMSDLT